MIPLDRPGKGHPLHWVFEFFNFDLEFLKNFKILSRNPNKN
jgi:hypothetical protein